MLGFFICLVAQPTSATLKSKSGVKQTKESIARYRIGHEKEFACCTKRVEIEPATLPPSEGVIKKSYTF